MFLRKTKTKKSTVQRFLTSSTAILALFFIVAPVTAQIEFRADATYNQEIWDMNQKINEKQKQADSLKRQIEFYQKSIASKRHEISTLSYQLSTIDQTMTEISLEKEALELNIDQINLQIRNSQLKIQATEENIAEQKERLGELIRELYRSDQQNNLLTILATNNSISEYLYKLQGLQSLQGSIVSGVDDLTNLKTALVSEQDELGNNKHEIEQLEIELEAKQGSLDEQRIAKYALISDTQGQESKYQELLQGLRDQQNQINSDIVALEQTAREQLNRQLKPGEHDLGSGVMIWPIPARTITAYFHDPNYPYRNIFEHPAIDIATPQGTPVRAADSGYVATAKNGGYGYSYIVLVHDNGISTVYGHISSISALEGTFVTQGQVIGLSGGKPRTPGAGQLTTGPHLHFEFRFNGIPVNPLNYLSQ